MANRFYTIMVVPEKSSQIRRIVVPSWILRGTLVAVFFAAILGTIMILDYWYVMSQIGENKQLRIANRRLQQRVQVYKNKVATVESTLERIQTFATRLKVITNTENRDELRQTLRKEPPLATESLERLRAENESPPQNAEDPNQAIQNLFSIPVKSSSDYTDQSEDPKLREEFSLLDEQFFKLNMDSLLLEQILQDQYELLADQKDFLAALPTRKPAVGYFTSGFGVRVSPYGHKVKMHEGIDVANRPGTKIIATADGIVKFAGTKPGYGKTVIVSHGYGLETWYAHARRVSVSKGQRVKRGDRVALLGNSGRSTGPHVHYEVRVNGFPVDPRNYILD